MTAVAAAALPGVVAGLRRELVVGTAAHVRIAARGRELTFEVTTTAPD
jgi:hypothetical protein